MKQVRMIEPYGSKSSSELDKAFVIIFIQTADWYTLFEEINTHDYVRYIIYKVF